MRDWPPPNYRPDFGTGYRVTFEDFQRLVAGKEYREVMDGFLREWFGYSISGTGPSAKVITRTGDVVHLRGLHEQIQADAMHQYDLYQAAMDFWR